MSEVLYSGGEGKEHLVITDDHIESGSLLIPHRAVTSVEVKSNLPVNLAFAAFMAAFGLGFINKDYKLLGYGVLAFAALVTIMALIAYPAKIIIRADGRKLQLAQGTWSKIYAVKEALARALAARK